MQESPLLDVDDLSVAYGAIRALRGLSLRVEEGEIVAVLGPNGAGKTTLLRSITGAVRAQGGSISFRGRKTLGSSPEALVRRGISLVPEGRHVFPRMTVHENLLVGALSRRDAAGIRSDLDEVFDLFPILSERSGQSAGTLSGGEQQQLAVARSLMSRPTLMLLDEPSLGLAPIVVENIMRLLTRLRDRGVTLLLVEQNVHRALEIADRAYVLAVGQLVLSGSARELAETGSIERAYLGFAPAGGP
jgi:branched-chain amino acid transport system ATP-binding protein